MKIYNIKSLIEGFKVNKSYSDKILVCCKATKGYTHIQYRNKIMKLPNNPLTTLPFSDKYGRGTYFLDYYEWKPAENEDLWNLGCSKIS